MAHPMKNLLVFEGRDDSAVPWPVRGANMLLACLILSGLFYVAFSRIAYNWGWQPIWEYRGKFVQGWLVTIGISIAALVFSTLFGVVAALLRRSRVLLLRSLAVLYVELIRGTPLLVQILIFFYVVGNALGVENRYVAGVLILSLFAGAYISEIIRSGIEGVAESQLESARAIGLTSSQTYRYVIFPQAIRQVLPPLAGAFVSLIKDSSLLSIISISEFTLNAREVNAFTYSTLESYLPLAIGYLVLTLPLSLWTRRLEQRFAYAD
jgi:polar amino acid transport system permease protein